LNKTISVLQQLSREFSKTVAAEIENTDLPWQKNVYTGYTSQGYTSVSLVSASGNETEVIIKDCANPQATPSLAKLPTLKQYLDNAGLSLMWARLHRLESGCCFWEHRDYSELENHDRVRLHIPITTAADSVLVIEGEAYHLNTDMLWYLRPNRAVHGFINGDVIRIHLILDCYVNDKLAAMMQDAYVPKDSHFTLTEPTAIVYDHLMKKALDLYLNGDLVAAEETLLKTFLQYKQPIGLSYDLVMQLYSKLNKPEKVQQWMVRKRRYLDKEELSLVQQEFADTHQKHIEGQCQDGDVGQFHRDVHSMTYDPDRLERVYDKYAASYDKLLLKLAGDGTSGCSYYTTSFFARVVPKHKGLHVLDAGVGTGIGGQELIDFGFEDLQLEGADLSSGMLEQARQRGIYQKLHHIRFPDSQAVLATNDFDAVLCAGSFSHGAMPASAMADFARVTKPGGIVVFSVRQSVYEEANSEMKAAVDNLVDSGIWQVMVEEVGEYLPADGVKAIYLACRVN